MCFCPPATSVSRRRRALSPSSPPRIVAALDLSKKGERAAHDLVRRLSSGRRPSWRLLGMHRRGEVLFVACEWVHDVTPEPFTLVEVSLDHAAMCWRLFPTADIACAELRAVVASDAKASSASSGY